MRFVNRLVVDIQQVTTPAERVAANGPAGRVSEIDGELIVTQTWENQERVADLLSALRASPSRGGLLPTTAPSTQP